MTLLDGMRELIALISSVDTHLKLNLGILSSLSVLRSGSGPNGGKPKSTASCSACLAALSPTDVKYSLKSFTTSAQSREYERLEFPYGFKQWRTVFHKDALFVLFLAMSFLTLTRNNCQLPSLFLNFKIQHKNTKIIIFYFTDSLVGIC